MGYGTLQDFIRGRGKRRAKLTNLSLESGEAADPENLPASALDRVVRVTMGRVTMVF